MTVMNEKKSHAVRLKSRDLIQIQNAVEEYKLQQLLCYINMHKGAEMLYGYEYRTSDSYLANINMPKTFLSYFSSTIGID